MLFFSRIMLFESFWVVGETRLFKLVVECFTSCFAVFQVVF